jgi:hypothetical protein
MVLQRWGVGAHQRLPGGDVVGEAGDGLQLFGFEGGVGDLDLAASWVGSKRPPRGWRLRIEEEAEFGDELVLVVDPGLVGGGDEGLDPFAAGFGDGVAGEEGEERLPLEGTGVEVGCLEVCAAGAFFPWVDSGDARGRRVVLFECSAAAARAL